MSAALSLPIVTDECEPELEELQRAARPRVRAECTNGPRPCPWASCRFHLAVADNARDTGAVRLTFPDLAREEMPETCALDVADRGEQILEAVGGVLGVTRERIRQIEAKALLKIRIAAERRGVSFEALTVGVLDRGRG